MSQEEGSQATFDAMMADMEIVRQEYKAKADAYTAQPRTMEEMLAYQAELRKQMMVKGKEIARKHGAGRVGG
jgi:hypothetical protein